MSNFDPAITDIRNALKIGLDADRGSDSLYLSEDVTFPNETVISVYDPKSEKWYKVTIQPMGKNLKNDREI